MTDIRELLQAATEDVDTAISDPVERVRRAAARRRRAQAAVVLVIATVAAAIIVPLSVLGGGTSAVPSDRTSPRPTRSILQTWESDDGSVAAGFGSIWGIQCCGGSTKQSWLDRLDPANGKRITRISLPGPTANVATGAGRVWTTGATDGGPSAISVVDPATSHVTTLRLSDVKAEPLEIAFSHGSAWVTFDVIGQVWRLTPTATGVDKTILDVSGGPQDIVTTGSGAIWVQRVGAGGGGLTRIVATRHSAHLGGSVPWPGDVYSSAGRSTLWASSERLNDIIKIDPAKLARCNACAETGDIVVRGPQIYTALSTARGLFVSTYANPMSIGHTNFYSTRDLDTSNQTPTARIAGGGSLAADGGGVVIGAGTAGLIHWVPAD